MLLDQTIAGRRCALWVPEGTGPFALSLCCCGSASELLPQLGALSPNRLFVSPEADWEIDFTPWPAPTLQGGRPFADGSVLGGAPAFLRWVEGELLPALAAQFALNPAQNSILGYSLGGLFALWAVCRCSSFFQCASSATRWADCLRCGPSAVAAPFSSAPAFPARCGTQAG